MPYVTWQEFSSGGRPQGGTIRESLQNFVANVAPQETPLLSGLQQVRVQSTYVEWLEDTLPARGFNAVKEGISYTEMAVSLPIRRFAHCQTFYKSGAVSDIERLVSHAGFEDPMVYAEQKAFLSLKNDIEHALHQGTAATGSTDAYRQIGGLLSILSTNFTNMIVAGDSYYTGVTLTESILNDILELVYANGTVQPSELYCGPKIKRTISGMNTKTTFQLNAAERRQILATDWYVSDFGDLKIFLARDQAKTSGKLCSGPITELDADDRPPTDKDNSFVVIDPRYFQTGWLHEVRREILPRDGLRDRFQLSATVCLICKSERAGGGARGLSANI